MVGLRWIAYWLMVWHAVALVLHTGGPSWVLQVGYTTIVAANVTNALDESVV